MRGTTQGACDLTASLGALETGGPNGCLEDGALESQSPATASPSHGGCRTHIIVCDGLDDAGLESYSGLGGGPTSSAGGCKPITYVPCRADS